MTRTDPAPHREPLTVTFSARTDVGLVRSDNEDNFLIDRKLRLYVVCDGLGGHASGEIASAAAVNAVREGLMVRRATLESYELGDGSADDEALANALRQAVAEANSQIHERGLNVPSQRGMGTTLSLLLLARDKAFLAHVGDSRIYRLRDGELRQLSRDHSLANELERGLSLPHLSERAKHQITRAVGVFDSVEVDLMAIDLDPGDRFLLSTDGLHGLVPASELAALLSDDDISLVADRLVDLANARGGTDNITAIALEVDAAPGPAVLRRIWPNFDTLRAAPIFRQLSERDLSLLVEEAQAVTLGPRDPLLTERRPVVVPGLFVVLEGELTVRRSGEAITALRVGDTFGEDALFIERSNTVDLVAGPSGARLLLLERDRFEALSESAPDRVLPLALALARTLARRVDAPPREGLKVVCQPSAYRSRPVTRPRTSPRLLVDTEPEPPRASPGEAEASPAPLVLAHNAAVMRRPRATERRIYPSHTLPAPIEPEPGPPPRVGPRSAELAAHDLAAALPPPLPPEEHDP